MGDSIIQSALQQQGPLTLKLTLEPAKPQPLEEKGEQTDAISQANGNLSNHLDKTVLEFIQFPLMEGDCAPPPNPLILWAAHHFPSKEVKKRKDDFSAYKFQGSAVKSARAMPSTKG